SALSQCNRRASFAFERSQRPPAILFGNLYDHVMDNGRIARTNFDGRDPSVLLERALNDELLDLSRASCTDMVRFGHGNDDVRLNLPAVRPLNGRGPIARIAFPRARIRPGGERVALR